MFKYSKIFFVLVIIIGAALHDSLAVISRARSQLLITITSPQGVQYNDVPNPDARLRELFKNIDELIGNSRRLKSYNESFSYHRKSYNEAARVAVQPLYNTIVNQNQAYRSDPATRENLIRIIGDYIAFYRQYLPETLIPAFEALNQIYDQLRSVNEQTNTAVNLDLTLQIGPNNASSSVNEQTNTVVNPDLTLGRGPNNASSSGGAGPVRSNNQRRNEAGSSRGTGRGRNNNQRSQQGFRPYQRPPQPPADRR